MKTIKCVLMLYFIIINAAFAADRAITIKDMQGESRFALVIGNSAYASAPLKNPANDAKLISDVLSGLHFKVTTLLDADQNTMKRAINDFGRELGSGGVGLFYFAGHGMQVEGRNYLIPVGAAVDSEKDVEFEAVDVGRIIAKMEAAGNRMNIVILDACRNNPFERKFRSAEKGLATVDAPMGTFIAYATAPGSVAADGDGANGIFTDAMAKAIVTPNAKIEDIFKATRLSVINRTGGKQIPWQSSSLVGDFYFNISGDASQPAVVQVMPPSKRDDRMKNIFVLHGAGENGFICGEGYDMMWKNLSQAFRYLNITGSTCSLDYPRKYEFADPSTEPFSRMWKKDNWYAQYELNVQEVAQYAAASRTDFVITIRKLGKDTPYSFKYMFTIYDRAKDKVSEYPAVVQINNNVGQGRELFERLTFILEDFASANGYSFGR